ncbi:MAG TPA: hypothetical protein VMN36_03200 [Verrucomicrobiales bacterium]|nr:hypothetical protein [Verrucomicrobiales bacterium]
MISQLTSTDASAQHTAINEALQFIEQKQRDENTTRLRELAASLIDSSADSAISGLPEAPADPQEQRLEKCWNLLGELSALEESADLQTLTEKAHRIAIAPADQQALLLDSLALELSSHLQNRRAALARRNELELLLTELEVVRSPEAADWRQRITALLAQPLSFDPALKLAEEARAWIEQTITEETRHEQRAAVLRALAATGYEVRDGMTTAWVEQGRIILRKPHESAYGIELSAPAQGSTFQTRVVALTDAQRDSQRDREVEETWCGEFEKARAALNEAGFNASLVQAHPAGSVPLKTIAISSANRNKRQSLELRNAPQRKSKE